MIEETTLVVWQESDVCPGARMVRDHVSWIGERVRHAWRWKEEVRRQLKDDKIAFTLYVTENTGTRRVLYHDV
jgi:hypothetical protein